MIGAEGKTSFAVLVLLLACVSTSTPATIRVEQDGSGDYTQIQPALDAVASGDTLLIGPGEYFQSNPSYIPGYAWDVNVYAFVRVDELTIIGAGAEETVIGPREYLGSTQTYDPKGLVWLEGSELRVSGITLRNCYDGIHATNAPIFVESCRFEDNRIGITWWTEGSGGGVSNSVFDSHVPGGPNGFYALGNGSDVVVEGCFFDGCNVSVKNLQNIIVRNCEIRNLVTGLQVDNGTYCLVEDSRIYDCSNVGVYLASPSVGEFRNCEVSGGGGAFKVSTYSRLLASNSVFYGGFWAVIEFQNSDYSELSNCHLLPGTGPAIRSYRHPSIGELDHDLRNNYWGTSDIDEVRALIIDGTDDPENTSTVLFEPIISQPFLTPVEDEPNDLPGRSNLIGVYPNPFNPMTSISYFLGETGHARLGVYDLKGRLVKELYGGVAEVGEHVVTWKGIDEQGRAMPSGTYFLRLVSPGGTEVKKVSLVR